MNRSSSTKNQYEILESEGRNNLNNDDNNIQIDIDMENFTYYFNLKLKNVVRNETDDINYNNIDNSNSVIIDHLISLTYNDVDYKDIVVNTWDGMECISKDASNIIFECLGLLPKVITGHYLRFVNMYQYNNYLSGKKGYDRIPNKYMTLEMARKIKENNGLTKIPDDLKKSIEQ